MTEPREVARPPHRDGNLIAGGLGYTLDELARLPPLPTYSSGFDAIDRATGGGLVPGAIWTLASPSGIGTTTFAVQVAAAAARTGSVLLANGHLATHLLAQRVRDAADESGLDPSARRRIRLASWLPMPWQGCADDLDSQYRDADVVILDTVDEMLRPLQLAVQNPGGSIRLRRLRELAQAANTAVVLTARTPPVTRPTGDRAADLAAFDDRWRTHWAATEFADVADVRLELVPSGSAAIVVAYVRGSAGWSGTARPVGTQRWLQVTAD